LNRLGENTRALSGLHEIPISDLFTPAFMTQHTNVATFQALVEAGGFTVASQADFDAIPDAEWENVIREHTSFSSWQQMQEKAGEEYAARKLTEGL
jgi:hypothetical protein